MITIERDIPIPVRKRTEVCIKDSQFIKNMEIGDSFFLPANNQPEIKSIRSRYGRIFREFKMKCTTRTMISGVMGIRICRTA